MRVIIMRSVFAILYVLALMLYILAGVALTPFHGDESTLIYTTRDYFDQFVARDLAQVTNSASDVNPMDSNLRLLDGRVQKYLGGFAYHLTGGTAGDLNQPWEWGGDVTYNRQNGNFPAPDVLMANRWAMAVLLALCIPAAFGVGMQIGGWPAALIFPALLAFNPSVLLNGRRAMMEAPLMLFSLLMALSALRWIAPHPLNPPLPPGREGDLNNKQPNTSHRDRANVRFIHVESPSPLVGEGFGVRGFWLIPLSLAAGLALSSKHSGVLSIVPVFGALGVLTLWRRDWRGLLGLFLAGVGALGVFYLFNPAWWPDPLGAARTVLRLRSELLAGQSSFFGGYAGLGEQLAGFWRQTFEGAPQYYEVSNWAGFIADDITAYQASPWGGLILGTVGGVMLAIFALLGIVSLSRRRDSTAWVFGLYAIGVILAALLLTPLEWARYYLVGLPGVFGLASAGASAVISYFRR